MLRIKFYLLGPKISALSSIIKILVFWPRKMAKLFCYRKPLNPYKMKTRNIFMIGNDFSRRFRRCRIRICNNLNLRFWQEGGVCLSLTSKIPRYSKEMQKKNNAGMKMSKKVVWPGFEPAPPICSARIQPLSYQCTM